MKALRTLLALVAAGLLGLLAADTLPGATGATPIAGTWSGGGHLLRISGTLEGGFTVAAGESWTIIGCPIAAGTVLTTYSPKGGSTYDAQYLWTENENGACSSSTRGPETVTVVLSGANSLSITGCGYAFCGSLTRVGGTSTTTTATKPKTTTTTATKPKTTTAAKDTSPPRVTALTKGLTKPASRARLQFRVSDDSGSAKALVALFEGGTELARTTSGWGPANGSTWWWDALVPADAVGPAYFCAQAVDRAGNKSKTSCAWISLLVPIEKVSNGCGGGGWDSMVAAQNYLGNEHTYQQSLGRSYTVDFSPACDVHDAGYGGHTVRDSVNGGIVDFHAWSRPQVDTKFLADLRKLCDRAIPASATNARQKCHSTGGTLSIGAEALYKFVHKFGWRFFDADLTKPGIQKLGHRNNF